MMPVDLVLVRHGESEGNVANRRSRAGDDSIFDGPFGDRHSSEWRLTNLGQHQGDVAGHWIREHIGTEFDRCLVSDYVRAQETAARLALPDARWMVEYYLREREYGDLDVMSEARRRAEYAASLKRRQRHTFYWRPPNGESIADLCLRIDRVLSTLHRECEGKRVIIVCHGEVMWAFRCRLERMTMTRWNELEHSQDVRDRIHNCQILHFTRNDPATRVPSRRMGWMRSVWPLDPTKSWNDWQPITRTLFTNEELLANVERHERMIDE